MLNVVFFSPETSILTPLTWFLTPLESPLSFLLQTFSLRTQNNITTPIKKFADNFKFAIFFRY